mmetsp:Transcript_470/g.864  ORF Transcript_470/g.864 Transcript_470/m.864 type:complete len:1240 (+) Transcript_470:104-3823(+)
MEGVRQFTAACEAIGQGGDGALVEFRHRNDALMVAREVLCRGEGGTMVQAQAVFLLRDAAVARWATMSAADQRDVREFVTQMAVHKWDGAPVAVAGALVQAAAVIWKRGWLGEDPDGSLAREKSALFEKLGQLVQGGANAVGVKLLGALVDEFSAAKASALGQSFAFHRRCKDEFEAAGLREAFSLGAQLLGALRRDLHGNALPPQAAPAVKGCLSLFESCLGWEFSGVRGAGKLQSTFSSSNSAGTSQHVQLSVDSVIQPGEAWREVLITSDLVETLFELYMKVRSNVSDDTDNLAHLIRQVLILLASLKGTIFADIDQQKLFVNKLLQSSLLGVLGSPLVPIHVAAGLAQTFEATGHNSKEELCAAGGAEYLDMCALVARVFSNFDTEVIISLQSAPPLITSLLTISKGLLEGAAICTQSRGSGQNQVHDEDADVDNSWLMEAFGNILEIWSSLASLATSEAQSIENTGHASDPSALLKVRDGIINAATDLYAFYVEKRLFMARTAMENEETETFNEEDIIEDPSAIEDHMLVLSQLGRANVKHAIDVLTNVMGAKMAALEQAAAAEYSPQSVSECGKLSEELYWVVLMAAFLLADSFDGERPMIPTSILKLSQLYCESFGPSGPTPSQCMDDPVVRLSNSLLSLLKYESERVSRSNGSDERVSPLLAEKVLFALTRWSRSYLVPENGFYARSRDRIKTSLPVSLSQSFGPNEQGSNIVDFVVQSATMYLSKWGIEAAVNLQALELLRAIVDIPNSRSTLLKLSSWKVLCEAHVQSLQSEFWAPLHDLTAIGQGSLGEILLRSLALSRDAAPAVQEQHQSMFAQLVLPISQRLERIVEALTAEARTGKTSLLDDPRWTRDFERLRAMYARIIRTADYGPLATWSRSLLVQDLVSKWTPLASASMVFVKKYGASSTTGSIARSGVSAVLELVNNYAVDQLQLTPDRQLPQVWETCDKIIAVYSDLHALLTVNSKGVDSDTWANDLALLLSLLNKIVDRFALDQSEDDGVQPAATSSNESQLAASTVVFRGISLTFPLVSREMLLVPGVALEFFGLLTNLVYHFEAQVVALTPTLFTPIVKALEFGIHDPRPAVARKSFEALSFLAEFHYSQTSKQPAEPGLGNNLYINGPGSPSILLHLLKEIFSFVVFQNFDSSLLNYAASAILILVICEKQSFASMVDAMVSSQPDPTLQQRLKSAFTKLMQDNGLQLSYTRQNKRTFEKNMVVFINETRGFMRSK